MLLAACVACAALGVSGPAAHAQGYPARHDHHDRSLPAGGPSDTGRAHHGRWHEQGPWPERRDRKCRWRRRNHRCDACSRGGAGRLHASCRQHGSHVIARPSLLREPEIRFDEGFRTDWYDCKCAGGGRGASRILPAKNVKEFVEYAEKERYQRETGARRRRFGTSHMACLLFNKNSTSSRRRSRIAALARR